MIKGILFDKDGTIVEFNRMWIDSTYKFLQRITERHNQRNKLEKIAFQIGLDGKTVRENSLLAGYTSLELADVISKTLCLERGSVQKELDQFYLENIKNHPKNIKPVCDVKKLFSILQENNYKIGIVTADNYDVTVFTLSHLGILSNIDFIATAELYQPKPHPEALHAFCEKFHMNSNEVIHIGDTIVDLEFAKHCQYGIGVLSGTSSKDTLLKATPFVLNHIGDLLDAEGNVQLPTIVSTI